MRYFIMIIVVTLLLIGCSNDTDWFEVDSRESFTEGMVIYNRVLLDTQWVAFKHNDKIVEFGLREDGLVVWSYKDNHQPQSEVEQYLIMPPSNSPLTVGR